MDWIDYVVFWCLSTFIALIFAAYAWVRYDFILAIGFGLIAGLIFLVLAPFAIFGVMCWALGEEKYREHIFGNDNSVNK